MSKFYERVGSSMIASAKRVDLREFLKEKYPDKIVYDEKSKQYNSTDDAETIIGAEGFFNFNTRYQGDQIQFLEDFLEMTFKAAVRELHIYAELNTDKLLATGSKADNVRMFVPPKRSCEKYKYVWSYLVYKRKIPHELVESLFDEKTLYQSYEYNNCVFYSKKCKFAEINGTTDNRFKQLAKGSELDGYWITGDADAEICYICKSAIDAISLKALRDKYCPDSAEACYISICGYNRDAIKRIKEEGYKNIIFAYPYGDETINICYNFELDHIFAGCEIGDLKCNDWNDMLAHCTDEKRIKNAIENIVEWNCPF